MSKQFKPKKLFTLESRGVRDELKKKGKIIGFFATVRRGRPAKGDSIDNVNVSESMPKRDSIDTDNVSESTPSPFSANSNTQKPICTERKRKAEDEVQGKKRGKYNSIPDHVKAAALKARWFNEPLASLSVEEKLLAEEIKKTTLDYHVKKLKKTIKEKKIEDVRTEVDFLSVVSKRTGKKITF